MNYRHAYHAGNHIDVFKHAALVLLLEHLRRKAKPFFVLDTHGGTGLYDLAAPEAERTGEAADGIGRVLAAAPEPDLAPYLDRVRPLVDSGRYPGSPAIAAGLLRDGDRLAVCELHPEDAGALAANFRRDGRVAVHRRDGYEALPALVPPPERRGLVLVDPPYEERDEADRVGRAVAAGWRKWATGIYAVWYPVKADGTGRAILHHLQAAGIDDCLQAEFLRHPPDGLRLAGGGLLVVNPPWQFDQEIGRVGAALARIFGPPASCAVRRPPPPA
ncbi:23S rRNA (adenine(2030)-N(6))-methyltransferase RlmJ [Stella sp.]|uniref:23S rRNA (adenine(2030)-N(6))-methyltransferase RlmJ n=1 Tax=Stella sp. TaxID=2912054 RepID=UPI0035AF819A